MIPLNFTGHADLLATLEAQRREIEALEADARRLHFLAAGDDERNPGPYLCDGFAGHDLHEKAWEVALLFGRDEAYPEDYLAAFRAAIVAAEGGK